MTICGAGSHHLFPTCAKEQELQARNLGYEFDAGTFWGWGFFGSVILIGPFVFVHKLLKSMNLINESYKASL